MYRCRYPGSSFLGALASYDMTRKEVEAAEEKVEQQFTTWNNVQRLEHLEQSRQGGWRIPSLGKDNVRCVTRYSGYWGPKCLLPCTGWRNKLWEGNWETGRMGCTSLFGQSAHFFFSCSRPIPSPSWMDLIDIWNLIAWGPFFKQRSN